MQLSILWVFILIFFCLLAFGSEFTRLAKKKYHKKESKRHNVVKPISIETLQGRLSQTIVNESVNIIDKTTEPDYYIRLYNVTNEYITKLTTSKSELKYIRLNPTNNSLKRRCRKRGKYLNCVPSLTLQPPQGTIKKSIVETTRSFISTSTVIPTSEYILNVSALATKKYFNSKLKNISLKSPVDIVRNYWNNHVNRYTTSSSFVPNSTLQMSENTFYDTTQLLEDTSNILTSSSEGSSCEYALNLTSLSTKNYLQSKLDNISMKAPVDIVKNYWNNLINRYSTSSSFVSNSTLQMSENTFYETTQLLEDNSQVLTTSSEGSSCEYGLNLTSLSTKNYLQSKLDNISMKAPVDIVKNYWNNHVNRYSTSSSFVSNSTLQMSENTFYETTQLLEDNSQVLTTSSEGSSCEYGLNLTSLSTKNYLQSKLDNISMKAPVDIVRNYWNNHVNRYSTSSSIVPNSKLQMSENTFYETTQLLEDNSQVLTTSSEGSSSEYGLNLTSLSTENYLQSKLNNISMKAPVDFVKNYWDIFANGYRTSPNVTINSLTVQMSPTIFNETTSLKETTSNETLTNELALNLTTPMQYSNSEFKSISLNSSVDFFKKQWLNHTHDSTNETLNNNLGLHLTTPKMKYSNSELKTISLNSSVDFFKNQWRNRKNLSNRIKNIYHSSNSNCLNLSTTISNVNSTIDTINNTYSLLTTNNISSNNISSYNFNTTPLPTIFLNMSAINTSTCSSFRNTSKNLNTENQSTISKITTTLPQLNLTLNYGPISSLNETLGLNISEKSQINITDVVNKLNLNESDNESWFSSIFNPIKNKLWFLWSETDNNSNNITIIPDANNTDYNLTKNQTSRGGNWPTMFVGSLNNTNLTVLLPMKENGTGSDSVLYTANISSLANITKNSSDPTLVIVNNTLVSVIANGSHMAPEKFNTKSCQTQNTARKNFVLISVNPFFSCIENGTWLGRARASVVHWMGDIYHCFTNQFEPATLKDVRFFLYTRNNSNKPEELFLKMQDITTTTEDDSDVPKPVLETSINSCNNANKSGNQSNSEEISDIEGTTTSTERNNEVPNDVIEHSVVDRRKKHLRKKHKHSRSTVEKHHSRRKHKHKIGVRGNRHDKHFKKKHRRPECHETKDFIALNPATSFYSKFFNILLPTKIIIHGYTQSYLEENVVLIRQAYLTKAPFNIIMVDWSSLSYSPCYPMVTKQSRSMGVIISYFIEQLAQGGINLATVHVIGFSLGAQIAGFAGATLETGDVYRLTGLDPASPFFDNDPGSSLDATDATFVDVIHTSAGFLGQPGPIGHADFYPNGGSQQPGCEFTALACSHDRAALYFAESISSETGFPAFECSSWDDFQNGKCNSTSGRVWMGDSCLSNTRGTFYLTTGETVPFSDLQQHAKIKKSLFSDFF